METIQGIQGAYARGEMTYTVAYDKMTRLLAKQGQPSGDIPKQVGDFLGAANAFPERYTTFVDSATTPPTTPPTTPTPTIYTSGSNAGNQGVAAPGSNVGNMTTEQAFAQGSNAGNQGVAAPGIEDLSATRGGRQNIFDAYVNPLLGGRAAARPTLANYLGRRFDPADAAFVFDQLLGNETTDPIDFQSYLNRQGNLQGQAPRRSSFAAQLQSLRNMLGGGAMDNPYPDNPNLEAFNNPDNRNDVFNALYSVAQAGVNPFFRGSVNRRLGSMINDYTVQNPLAANSDYLRMFLNSRFAQ